MILTFEFLGAASKTLTRGNLTTEGSLLADAGKVRKATAVRRRTVTLRYTFLLVKYQLIDFPRLSVAGDGGLQHTVASWQDRSALPRY